jgi:hypothetical protein
VYILYSVVCLGRKQGRKMPMKCRVPKDDTQDKNPLSFRQNVKTTRENK